MAQPNWHPHRYRQKKAASQKSELPPVTELPFAAFVRRSSVTPDNPLWPLMQRLAEREAAEEQRRQQRQSRLAEREAEFDEWMASRRANRKAKQEEEQRAAEARREKARRARVERETERERIAIELADRKERLKLLQDQQRQIDKIITRSFYAEQRRLRKEYLRDNHNRKRRAARNNPYSTASSWQLENLLAIPCTPDDPERIAEYISSIVWYNGSSQPLRMYAHD